MVLFILVPGFMNIYITDYEIDAKKEYGIVIATVLYFIAFTPLMAFPVVLGNILGIVRFNPFQQVQIHSIDFESVPRICFRIVTKGTYKKLILSNLLKNREVCSKSGLTNVLFEVVTDDDIPDIKDSCKCIVVPKKYQTKQGTLYKARALNYCLEPGVSGLTDQEWVVHLDEETILTRSSVYGIINFIKDGKADIGQGAISYANGEVLNWLTTLADSIRLALDYGLFRFQLDVFHRPMFGFKGSYIVLKQCVENDVGLDFGPRGSIAEDIYFALLAWEKGYKFGFILGEMQEKSPFTCMDYIRQRRRWFVGQMFTALSREIPLYCKLCLILSLSCSIMMPISISNIFLPTLFPFTKPIIIQLLTGFLGGTFAFLYFYGAFKSLQGRQWSISKMLLVCIVTCVFVLPLAACMDCLATFWGLFVHDKQFHLVQKDMDEFERSKSHGLVNFLGQI
ncbi:hypothetical protein CHS0354_008015 [Potamilus streckersoni]|uniref:Glycosyltransferase 2-like domain-containing protein n=1 Tax=Potamilus streckersoni TaxID=2493646 RepID=A0AAE0T1H2_9BIVA|nr:hypothetical protein CHS0354_008015 [Potamilus streckersoni]